MGFCGEMLASVVLRMERDGEVGVDMFAGGIM